MPHLKSADICILHIKIKEKVYIDKGESMCKWGEAG